ncbi:putative PEPTIDE SYNTHETASE NRP domain protein [Mycobacterium xenopi 4042]|uniref:Putative PEPTIDE SYNTHETASE NRP domain protein n=1 Tax=Mycobacterium xenopi 4042 TaxID=1299334 RepID=X7ZER5_MYCXE|nr:putative PEPTIDE SYNTHETASE NRP domain protein [Mycobacterium xenopi 4042]
MMQAALAVLLSKLAASAEVAIGFPIGGGVTRCWMSWWVFRQHLGVAGGFGRQSQHRGGVGQGARAQPGRLRAPGCAV